MIEAKQVKVEIGENPTNRKDDVIYFESFEEMNKVLTSGRILIIETIRSETPESVYELAKIMDKDQANLNKDIKVLEKYGFLEIRKEKSGERVRSKPETNYDLIEMTVKLGSGLLGVAKEVLDEVGEEFREENVEKNKNLVKKETEKFRKKGKRSVEKIINPVRQNARKISKKVAKRIVELAEED